MAPWGHGKTQIIGVGLPAYLIGRRREIRIKEICNTEENARARLRSLRRYIEQDEDYRSVFPHVEREGGGEWTQNRFSVRRGTRSKDATFEAHGIDCSGIGGRCDVLIADDPVDVKDAMSEAVRRSRIERFLNVWMSRLDAGGYVVYIATRWHTEDLTARLMENEQFSFLVQRVTEDFSGIECEVDGEVVGRLPVWGERWSEERLRERFEELGRRAFNRGFRQDPYDEKDRLFNWEAVERFFRWDVKPEDVVDSSWPRYGGVDLSSEERPGTVIFVLARSPDGVKYPLHVRRGNWGWGPQTARQVEEVHRNFNVRLWNVESNAAQKGLVEWLRVAYGRDFPVRAFLTTRRKVDPQEGLPSLAVEMENGGWFFALKQIEGHKPDCGCGWCTLIREIRDYPISGTTDCLMAMWFASEASKRGRGRGATAVEVAARRQFVGRGGYVF